MADAWNKGRPSLTTLCRSLAEPSTQLTRWVLSNMRASSSE